MWYMASTSAVTTRAQTLAGLLKAALDKSPLSARGLAKLMDVSHVTVGRYVNGDTVPDVETVVAMLAHLGVNGEDREAILKIARRAGESDWLTTGASGISQQLAGVMEIERTTTAMIDWSPLFVPGMLQVASYARAIFRANPARTALDVDHMVNVRMGRQHAILREDPIRLTAFLGEPAIRGGVGGREVMLEQLRHLVRASQFEPVTLHVVPVDGDWHGGLSGPFLLYEQEALPPVLHLEHHRTGAFVTEAADVRSYEELVDTLRNLAWSPDDSRALIEEEIRNRETAE
jgi:transcriptional regulator with XRE-family HTH domain